MRIFFMVLGLMVLSACSAAPVDDAPINGGPDDNWRVVGLGEACGGMAGIMCEGEPSGAAYCAYAPAARLALSVRTPRTHPTTSSYLGLSWPRKTPP